MRFGWETVVNLRSVLQFKAYPASTQYANKRNVKCKHSVYASSGRTPYHSHNKPEENIRLAAEVRCHTYTGPIQTVSFPVLLWNISNPSFMTTHDAVYRNRTQKSIVALICKQTALLIECWTGYVLFNYTYMISIFSVYDGACVFGLPNSPVVLTRSEFNYYWSDLRFPGTALNTSERR